MGSTTDFKWNYVSLLSVCSTILLLVYLPSYLWHRIWYPTLHGWRVLYFSCIFPFHNYMYNSWPTTDLEFWITIQITKSFSELQQKTIPSTFFVFFHFSYVKLYVIMLLVLSKMSSKILQNMIRQMENVKCDTTNVAWKLKIPFIAPLPFFAS